MQIETRAQTAAAPVPVGRRTGAGDRGITLIEFLVAAIITLIVMIATYDFIEASKKRFVAETNITTAQATGRSIIDIMSSDVRLAGYSPLGPPFDAIPAGDGNSIRLVSDRAAHKVASTMARKVVQSNRGATERTLDLLTEILQPAPAGVTVAPTSC